MHPSQLFSLPFGVAGGGKKGYGVLGFFTFCSISVEFLSLYFHCGQFGSTYCSKNSVDYSVLFSLYIYSNRNCFFF